MNERIPPLWSLVALALALPLLGAPVNARAQTDDARASEFNEAGKKKLAAKDATGAMAEFRAAYTASRKPDYLYNLAFAARRAGDDAAAAEAFHRFALGTQDPDRRRYAESQLLELRKTLAQLEVASNEAGATVELDGANRGVTPLETALWITPGEHRLSLAKPGFTTVSRTLRMAANQQLAIELPLARVPIPLASSPGASDSRRTAERPISTVATSESAPPEQGSVTSKWWFWSTIGAVVAGGVVTAIALSSSSSNCPSGVDRCL